MTNQEAIDRWARYIIPAVFRAETDMLNEEPEWRERIDHATDENIEQVASDYCKAIATRIVKASPDFNPDEPTEQPS